jgi:hypothetical protein
MGWSSEMNFKKIFSHLNHDAILDDAATKMIETFRGLIQRFVCVPVIL